MTIRFIGPLLCGAVFALVTTTDVVAKYLGGNVGGGIGRDHLAKKPVAPKKHGIMSPLQIKNIRTGPDDDAKVGGGGGGRPASNAAGYATPWHGYPGKQ
jgi:hypothetical protein